MFNFSSNVIGDSNDGTNFQHQLCLIDTQVSWLHKVFKNNPPVLIKSSI